MTPPVATGQLNIKELEPPDPQGRLCSLTISSLYQPPDLVDSSSLFSGSVIFLNNAIACEVSLTGGGITPKPEPRRHHLFSYWRVTRLPCG